jgi:hypothetical protein
MIKNMFKMCIFQIEVYHFYLFIYFPSSSPPPEPRGRDEHEEAAARWKTLDCRHCGHHP